MSSGQAAAPSSGRRRRCPMRCFPRRSRRRCAASGDDGDKVRGALERDFATYSAQAQRDRSRIRTLLLLTVARPLLGIGRQGDRELAVPHRQRRLPGSAGGDPREDPGGFDAAGGRGCAAIRRRGDRRAHRASDRQGRSRLALDFAAGEWRNGRRAGLRSRCRESGVEVRSLSRLQILDGGRPRRPRTGGHATGRLPGSPVYCSDDASHLHTRPRIDRPARSRASPGAAEHAPSTTPSAGCRATRASPASARQGPATRPRAAPRPGRGPRRSRRAPGRATATARR